MNTKNLNKYNIENNKKLSIIIGIIIGLFISTIYLVDYKNNNNNEPKNSQQRKQENIEILKKEGISYIESLPAIEDSTEITLRTKKEILSRAIASYATSNIAIDYNWHKENFEESRKVFGDIINKFGVKDSLTKNEQIMLSGTPTDEIALNVEWTIESSKVLFWILGFIKELNYPSQNNMTNANEINQFILKYNSIEEMLNDTKLLNSEIILDYTDLYYRYHWACVDKSINDNVSIGSLSSDIVYERRRAFEWTIDSQEDWDNFDAST